MIEAPESYEDSFEDLNMLSHIGELNNLSVFYVRLPLMNFTNFGGFVEFFVGFCWDCLRIYIQESIFMITKQMIQQIEYYHGF